MTQAKGHPGGKGLPSSAVERARYAASVEALARALAATAEGETVRAIEALASVVVNRMEAARARRAPPHWGVELGAAVRASCLAAADAVTVEETRLLAACRRIAARAASGALPDPTGGAVFWHRTGTRRPEDAEGGPGVRIGGFVFRRAAAAPPRVGQGWTDAEP